MMDSHSTPFLIDDGDMDNNPQPTTTMYPSANKTHGSLSVPGTVSAQSIKKIDKKQQICGNHPDPTLYNDGIARLENKTCKH
jgi:hypothetical protein